MKITAWRITNKRHANDAFSGGGAKLYGGRWNPPGYPAVYTADSLSLAILELIVHLDEDGDLQDFVAGPVIFEDACVTAIPESKLPENWSCLPISDQTQHIGKTWIEERQFLVLKVPSSVVHNDYNFVINPLHPAFPTLQIGNFQPLQIDPRIGSRLH
jgi:RES domain-containing protein